MLDAEDVWINVPGAREEDAEAEYLAEKEDRRLFRIHKDAQDYVAGHEARELAKRLIAEKAALERGPLSSRVHDMAAVRGLELPKHLVRHFLYTGSVAVVLGDSQVGKSWVMQSVACCAAAGLDWPSMLPSSKGRLGVLYIAAEDGGSVKFRLEHWEAAHGRNLDSAPVHILPETINLLDEVVVEEICEFVKANSIRMVVVDTVSAIMGGEEETNENFARLVRHCRRITAAMAAHGGGSVVLVHHFGKDKEKGGRGGSSLFNDTDIVWELTGDIHNIVMTNKKWKVDEKRKTIHLRLDTLDGTPRLVVNRQDSTSTEAPPDEYAVLTLEVERACRDLAALNQGYGPNARAIMGSIRERGGQWRTQIMSDHLATMAATGRLITHSGPNRQTFHRLPPVQDQL